MATEVAAATKSCSRCGSIKLRTEFQSQLRTDRPPNPRDPEGMYRVAECPSCRSITKRAVHAGVSREIVAAMVALGECEVCGDPHIHFDHCHSTGQGRGVLCRACSTALGQMRDDPKLLRRLAAYVERAAI